MFLLYQQLVMLQMYGTFILHTSIIGIYILSFWPHVSDHFSQGYSRLQLPFVLHLVLSGWWFLFLGTVLSSSGVHFITLVIFLFKTRASLLARLESLELKDIHPQRGRYITETSFAATQKDNYKIAMILTCDSHGIIGQSSVGDSEQPNHINDSTPAQSRQRRLKLNTCSICGLRP